MASCNFSFDFGISFRNTAPIFQCHLQDFADFKQTQLGTMEFSVPHILYNRYPHTR